MQKYQAIIVNGPKMMFYFKIYLIKILQVIIEYLKYVAII